jgi:hypothetical protein
MKRKATCLIVIMMCWSLIALSQSSISNVFKLSSKHKNDNSKHNAKSHDKSAKSLVYKPSRMIEYYPDSENNNLWVFSDNDTIEYDNNGFIIRETLYDESNNYIRRILYSYAGWGYISEERSQTWSNNAWVDNWRYTYQYDSHNNTIQALSEYYSNGNWTVNWGYQYSYSYDINNNIITETEKEWDSDSSSFVNSWQDTYTYNNNIMIEVLEKEWFNNSWVNAYKIINIVWKDYNKFQPLSYTEQEYINNTWKDYYKTTIDWSQYDSVIEITLEDTLSNGNWINFRKYIDNNDSHYNEILWQEEYWENNTWVIDYGGNYIYTYDNDKMTSRIYKYWSEDSSAYINDFKVVFSDFKAFSGINNISNEMQAVSVFPNPANDFVNININLSAPQSLSVKITDITGREINIVYEKNYEKGKHLIKLDIKNYAPGLYFINLMSDNKNHTTKLIVNK